MKKLLICVCVAISLFIAEWDSSFAQQPQYYNYNTQGSGSNSFPFNASSGKQVQLLYLPGDFNQPTPAPAGTITSISFMISQTSASVTKTYTDLTIRMGQSSITSFDSGSFYSGTLTTVYHRDSVSLTGTAGKWMTITLDTPFHYNPTQSLIVDVGQCGSSGGTGLSVSFTAMTGNRRIWSVGGCPFVAYNSTDEAVYHVGLTIEPIYYNYNTSGNANSFPFNISSGKQVQLLYLPGDFNQPTPAPAGTVKSISFMIHQSFPLGPFTYADFTIKMGQSGITSFDGGSFYSGTLTTVYHRDSVSLTGTAGQWMTITLDTPFDYDPTKSLIVDIGQCGAPGATGYSATFTAMTGNRRIYSVGGCPFVYSSTDTKVYHMGLAIGTHRTGMFYAVPNRKDGTAVIYLE